MTFIGSVASAARPYTGTLTIGILNKIDSLSPFIGIGNEAYLFYTLIYDPMFSVDQDQNFVPDIATDAIPNQDGTAWTYPIRTGVKWHDGTPLTADDVAFTFNYNIQNVVQLWAFQPYVNSLQSATVTGPNEVTLSFNGPFAPGKAFDAPYILQESHWQGISASHAQYFYEDCDPTAEIYPVGTGPFKVTPDICNQWKNDLPIVLERNPNYWAGPPAIEKLVFRRFNDENAMVFALENGEVDVAWMTANGYKAIEDVKNQNPDPYPFIQQQEGLDVIQMWVDIGISQAPDPAKKLNPARYDLHVRQAMAMATDKTFILDQFYKGKGRVGSTLVSPITPFWHYKVTTDETFPYDLAQANATLDAAGYDEIREDGIRIASRPIDVPEAGVTVPTGTPLSFSMVARIESEAEKKIAQYLQQNWKQVGIELGLTFENEVPTMNDDIYAGNVFDTYVWWWSSDPDPNYILSIQAGQTVGGWNDNFFDNASYNDAYTKQLQTMNATQRQSWAWKAQQVNYHAAPYIIVVYPYYEVAYWTDIWVGWGDMNAHPGRQIGAFFGKHPLFLELQAVGAPKVVVQGAAGRPGELLTIQGQINDTTSGTWWLDFGDGASLESGPYSAGTTDVSRQHAYTLPQGETQANFIVKLSAANGAYNVTKTNTVTVQAAGALPPTIVTFSVDKTQIAPGGQVNFTAKARNSQTGSLTFSIDYADGSPRDNQTVSVTAGENKTVTFTHVYTKEGSFPAALTVAGTTGTTPAQSSTITIVVSSAEERPSGVSDWVLPAAGLVVAVAVGVTALLVWRRSKQEREEIAHLPPPPPPKP